MYLHTEAAGFHLPSQALGKNCVFRVALVKNLG